MSEILQSVSLLDDSGLANGCNSRLSGQNTSKSSRGAFNLKVESSRNGVLGQAGGGKINVCHNACLLIINKVFAMTKVHLFFVNNKHFAFFMGIFLSTSALCYYLRLHAHFSI